MIRHLGRTTTLYVALYGDINIGISVVKGNTFLLDAMNEVLGEMTVEDFNNLMDQAIAIQPVI